MAEFGSKGLEKTPADVPVSRPEPEEREGEGRNWREDTIPFPVRPQKPEQPPAGGKPGIVTNFPGMPSREEFERKETPDGFSREEESPVPEKAEAPVGEEKAEGPEEPDEAKVLEFPQPSPENPVTAGLDKLRRRADEFAGHMYEAEGVEDVEAVRRAEELIPGVDEEEILPVRERRPRRKLPPAPDLPPADLAKRYSKGLKAARVRTILVFLLILPLLYLTLAESMPLPLPSPLAGSAALRCYTLAVLQGAAIVLGLDGIGKGLIQPFQRRIGLNTLVSLANIAVLADALTLPMLSGGGIQRQPFCVVGVLSLWCLLWGDLQKRRGQRMACRTAASASEPYLVTRDEGKWNGRDTYVKWSGPPAGFGSQIQEMDGAERIYRVVVPVLLLACVLFSCISSLGRGRGGDFLWCLAATLSAAASLSASLCFGLPWRKLSSRLAKSGAALAGWEGVTNTTGSSNLLLTDIDLFPPGAVTLNGVKIFGDFSIEKVVGVTATVIREAGSGLEKMFHDLLRSQGTVYRRGEQFTAYEGGGASEVIRGQLVLVGSAPFMALMEVALPPGLNVKNAVFCAIDGELAGIFALNYHLSGAVPPAIDALIHNHITPVLATRDFNLIPSMLRQRFKLPVEKMEFPPVERRRELSEAEQDHSETLTAVLCREGVGPYAEAVVGGKRLRLAVRLSAGLACIGSAVGALLAFYLTFVAAYTSLTPINLMVFLLMWLVPTPLISGWVDRY